MGYRSLDKFLLNSRKLYVYMQHAPSYMVNSYHASRQFQTIIIQFVGGASKLPRYLRNTQYIQTHCKESIVF